MSGILSVGGAGAVGVSGFYPVQINDSLRFEDGSSAYLNRTPSSAGNRKTWTWSGWVKRGNIGLQSFIFTAGADSNNRFQFGFETANDIQIEAKSGGSTQAVLNTTGVFRDSSAWYHILVSVDTTQATSSNRLKLYINGELVTALDTATYPSQNADLEINKAIEHNIGKRTYSTNYSDGYLSDINFIDGQALDATSFGEAKDGTWIPKSYSGSYGTNGFHLEFNGNSNDTSGNGNNWTANNISAHDYVPDSPTNNFAVMNPLNTATSTLSEGNLKVLTQGSGFSPCLATFGQKSGKWYWEHFVQDTSTAELIGVVDDTWEVVSGNAVGYLLGSSGVDSIAYYTNGNKYINGTATSYGSSYTTNDFIGVALNLDDDEITFYKNGVSQGVISYTFSGNHIIPANGDGTGTSNTTTFIANFGQDSTFAGATTAGGNTDSNGVGDFKYAVPSGFLALATSNLPEPTIIDGSEYFNTVLYTGNGTSQSITGVGFQPDWTWIKSRAGTYGAFNHTLWDVVRGAGADKELTSSQTYAEGGANTSLYGYVSALDSDGFTLTAGSTNSTQVNGSSTTYAAWNWKAGGAAVSNTDGTITSQVSANVDAGFSIVSFDFQSTGNQTIGHSLGVQPSMIIMKSRDSSADAWWVYHESLGASNYLRLNSTNASSANSEVWSTTPTNQVFTIGSLMTTSNYGTSQIAYCFANTEGYLKAGSYTGNGSTDGPFVYTGFRPAWVMTKRTNTTGEWWISDISRDPYNTATSFLWAQSSGAEVASSSYAYDILSNGFKLRTTYADRNASGSTFIYLAFAEHPFKYSNAR